MVRKAWRPLSDPFSKLDKCLHSTKKALSKWNKENVRNIIAASSEVESKISKLQEEEAFSEGITNEEKSERTTQSSSKFPFATRMLLETTFAY